RRFHVLILIGFAGLTAGSIFVAQKLELRTDLAELLPEGHPSVMALRRVAGRQKSATNLVIILDSPSAEANKKFADALKPEFEKLIPEVFTEIQWGPNSEIPDHAEKWKWLYTDEKDLEKAEGLLDRIIAHRKSPLYVDLEGDPEAEL